MCGIVGYVNREKVHLEKTKFSKYFTNALMCDTVRGHHGTGVLGVTDKGEVNVYKKPISAFDFLELSRTKSIIDKDNIFMVGHNRFATKGGHTIDNSHPFTHDGVTLFHNGTLTSYYTLCKDRFDTDSEHACKLLSESESKIEALEKIEGAYSFVWYDERDTSLNFARNEDRPMFIAQIKGSDSFLFASEGLMIEWLADRNQLIIDKPKQLKSGKLLSIYLDGSKPLFKDFTIKETEQNYYQYNYSNYYNSGIVYSKDCTKNINSQNNKFKYAHLANVDSIQCTAKRFESFKGKSNFNNKSKNLGYLICEYNPLFDVKVYIEEGKAIELVNKTLNIKVDTISNALYGYGHIIEKNNIKYLPIVNNKEIPDDTKFERMTNGKFLNFSQFKKATESGCPNCGANIYWNERDRVKWTDHNDVLCPTCTNEFNFVIGVI